MVVLQGESLFINAIAATVRQQVRSLPCLRRGQRRDRQPAAAIKLSWSVLGLLLESAGGSLGRKGKHCFLLFLCCSVWIWWECDLKPRPSPSSDCQDLHVNYATITSLISLLLFLETLCKKRGKKEREWETHLQNSECSLSLSTSNRSSIITCSP